MKLFNTESIKTKLTALIVGTSGLVLLVAGVGYLIHDFLLIRDSKAAELTTLAHALGSNSTAALMFNQRSAAEELLASLRFKPEVTFACIYDAQGNVFATYGDDRSLRFRPSEVDVGESASKRRYTLGAVDIVEAIADENSVIGHIFLHASMHDVYRQICYHAGIGIIVFMGCVSVSALLSLRLQRIVSGPILHLAETAKRISTQCDYSVRVYGEARGEIGALYEAFNNMLERIQEGQRALRQAHDQLERRVEERTKQLTEANTALSREVAERRRAQKLAQAAQEKLLEAARLAGKADVASAVLHNVGNVLNSINISVSLLREGLRNSEAGDLGQALELLEEHLDDLPRFISQDARGKHLLRYILQAGRKLVQENAELQERTEEIVENIEHIKAIIGAQQQYASSLGLVEATSLNDVIDQAIKLCGLPFQAQKITVVREYADLPPVLVDRHKLLEVVINLVKNARESVLESGHPDPWVRIRTRVVAGNQVQVQVEDNGVGIAEDQLTRIFAHGFTSKKGGHGFGLHSCANAAKEMGGSLRAWSAGCGKGATFTLELPFRPIPQAARDAG